ncbi:hypothetical protein ACWA2C_16240 [Priestia megaterium]
MAKNSFNIGGTGVSILINSTARVVIRDGKTYEIPYYVNTNTTSTINGNVYIGGYQLTKKGQWKRTLKALWYHFF